MGIKYKYQRIKRANPDGRAHSHPEYFISLIKVLLFFLYCQLLIAVPIIAIFLVSNLK
jgi:flagellar biosynthesis protein FliR